MCFVSYIPHQDGYLLGSNRDEHRNRKPARFPGRSETNSGAMVMPLDGQAGGTWISLRDDGVSAVLLNGAFINHIRRAPYRHSRGLIIPTIMHEANPLGAFEKYNLLQLEPFTLIMVQGGLYEWRWDGEDLHLKALPADGYFCWSSATLYDATQQRQREHWFRQAIEQGEITDATSLMQWQRKGGLGNKQTDIVLCREDGIGTVSTTVISAYHNTFQMAYHEYPGPECPELVNLTGQNNRLHGEERLVQEIN